MSRRVAPADDATNEHNLTANYKAAGISWFLPVALLLGTTFVLCTIFVARINAMAYVGVVGVFSGAMWMPYLIALIVNNSLYKKLAYAPLTAPIRESALAEARDSRSQQFAGELHALRNCHLLRDFDGSR